MRKCKKYLKNLPQLTRVFMYWNPVRYKVGFTRVGVLWNPCPTENLELFYFAYHTLSQEQVTFLTIAGYEGFPGYPAHLDSIPHVGATYHDCVDTFSRRICSRKHADFDEWLTSHRIDPDTNQHLSKLSLLGYTNGGWSWDGFWFAPDWTTLKNDDFKEHFCERNSHKSSR